MLFKYINWSLLLSVVIVVTAVPPPKPRKHDARPNLPKWMDSEQTNERDATDFSHSEFHSSVGIYEQFERIGKLGGNVKLRNLTNKLTNMGREIKLITIQEPAMDDAGEKSTIFVVAGVQGRDWYSVAAAMFLVHQLTMRADKNEALIKDFNWWIAPLVNPDGYNLSMSNCFRGFTVRDWRKNCNHNYTYISKIKAPGDKPEDEPHTFNHTIPQLFHCGGIDIGKNFEYQWINYDYKDHANKTHCDKEYPGKNRHHAPEADPLFDLLGEENEAGVTLFINIREGAEAVAYPYCYTKRDPTFKKDMEDLTTKAADAGMFKQGQSSHLFPMHAGGMEDYIEAHFGVRNSISLYIKDYRMSKKLNRGAKIRTRSRRAFRAIRELAKNHKKYNEESSGGAPSGRVAAPAATGRSAFRGRRSRYRGFIPPGGLAVRRSGGSALSPASLTALLVSLLGTVWP